MSMGMDVDILVSSVYPQHSRRYKGSSLGRGKVGVGSLRKGTARLSQQTAFLAGEQSQLSCLSSVLSYDTTSAWCQSESRAKYSEGLLPGKKVKIHLS